MSNRNRNNRNGQQTEVKEPVTPVVEAKDEPVITAPSDEQQSEVVVDEAVVDAASENDDVVVAKTGDEGVDEEPPEEDPNGDAARGETAVIAHVDESPFVPTGELEVVGEASADPVDAAADQPVDVADVLEFAQYSDFPTVGVEGKIYINQADGATYCWMEDIYVEVVPESEEEKSPLQTLIDPPAPYVAPVAAEAPAVVAPEAETPATVEDEELALAEPELEPVKELTLEEFYAPLKDESRNFTESAVTAFRERMVSDRKAGLLDKEAYVALLRLLGSKVFKDIDRWQDSSLVRWAETGQEAGRVGKMLKHDRVRAKALVERWADEELIALIMRKIEPTFNVDVDSACREFARRRGLNPLLTKEQVRVYLETEVLPKSVYHESDLFQLKPAYYWSDVEINEFIQGRLGTTKVVTATDIYDEYRRRHELTQSSFPDARIQGLQGTNETGVKVHMALKILTAELNAYAEKMAPAAAITEQGAGAMQTSLYRQMTRVLALDGQDFVTGWTELLDFVQAHKESHFTEARAFRGLSSFQLGSRDRATFEQLMNLCIRTADPKVRYDAAKNINFGVVLAKISNETTRHRVLAYYRVGQ